MYKNYTEMIEGNQKIWKQNLSSIFHKELPKKMSCSCIYDINKIINILSTNNSAIVVYNNAGFMHINSSRILSNESVLCIDNGLHDIISPEVLVRYSTNEKKITYFSLTAKALDPLFPEHLGSSDFEMLYLSNDGEYIARDIYGNIHGEGANKTSHLQAVRRFIRGHFLIVPLFALDIIQSLVLASKNDNLSPDEFFEILNSVDLSSIL
jgi:hypothetical protein